MARNAKRWILVSAGALVAAGAAATQQAAFKPVASVTQIMQAMVVPSSNALFDVPRNPPADEAGWAAVRNHAIVLAESGNLLLIGDRAPESEVWTRTARGLAEAGQAALVAAQAEDADGIADAGNQIIEACEGCHQVHWVR